MADLIAKSWLNEPGSAVSGLLGVIAASLGGDLVLWIRVDVGSGHTSILEIVDPEPAAQTLVELLRSKESWLPDSLGISVARTGKSLLIPRLDLSTDSIDKFPAPLPEYLANYPIVGIIAVPVQLEDGATGVLIAARRTSSTHYTQDDLQYVESGARRLVDNPVDIPIVNESVTFFGRLVRILTVPNQRFRFREILFGAGPPLLVTSVLISINNVDKFRPGVVFLLGCVVAAVFGGARAAILASLASTLSLWWAFTPISMSWKFETLGDSIGIINFFAASVGVTWMVLRLDNVRDRERVERQLSDSVLEQSLVPMAVFDSELRFRRVNQPMAEINGRSVRDHVGLRPNDLSPLLGQMYEHLLRRVRDSGQPVANHELKIVIPKAGFESHWNLSLRPLRNLKSEVVGIGLSIIDVTQEDMARRQAEQLFELAESLSTAIDERRIAESICKFLIDMFHGRAAVAFRSEDKLVITALSGFGDDARRQIGAVVNIQEPTPMSDAVRMNRTIIVSDIEDFVERYPDLTDSRALDWDQASVSVPMRGNDPGLAFGVMYIGWARSRPITGELTIVLRTVSSLATLALARIAATNLAHRDEFRHALDAMLDDVAIARSVRSDSGKIIDFRIEFVNSIGVDGTRRDAELIVGRLVCDVNPNWRASGMFDRLCNVVETGVPYQVNRMRFSDLADGSDTNVSYRSLQIAKLGDGYIAASRDVSDLVAADAAALTLALQVETELTSIQLLQSAALPNTLPESPGVRISAVYQPSDPRQPVGGDWYDAFSLDENRVALVIADVAGHGRHAAIFMVQVRNVFRALAVEHAEPGEVMIRANNVTSQLNEVDGPFVTCCYAVLDVRTLVLRWAQAGHFSPLIVHPDGATTYLAEHPGPPLALSGERHYESSSAILNPGDRVLMFTDGMVERRDEHLDVGLVRLAKTAKANFALPPQEFVEALAESIIDRFDDLALLCVELTVKN